MGRRMSLLGPLLVAGCRATISSKSSQRRVGMPLTLLDGREPLRGDRDLDHDVGPVAEVPYNSVAEAS